MDILLLLAIIAILIIMNSFIGTQQNIREQNVSIKIYKAVWCHHCQSFEPEIEKLRNIICNGRNFIRYL
jgi:thiol-disulfide isomerase/thioredoxin